MRKFCTLSLLAVLALGLGVTLGLFGLADGDDCSACAGRPCTVLCAACACCAGTLPSAGVPRLAVGARAVPPATHRDALPLSADPRGILHVPRSA